MTRRQLPRRLPRSPPRAAHRCSRSPWAGELLLRRSPSPRRPFARAGRARRARRPHWARPRATVPSTRLARLIRSGADQRPLSAERIATATTRRRPSQAATTFPAASTPISTEDAPFVPGMTSGSDQLPYADTGSCRGPPPTLNPSLPNIADNGLGLPRCGPAAGVTESRATRSEPHPQGRPQ